MARSKKRSVASDATAPGGAGSGQAPADAGGGAQGGPGAVGAAPLGVRLRPYALLTLAAVVMFLGFGGFAIWPLAFFGMLPALFVFDPQEGRRGGFERPGGKVFFRRALFFGYLAETGGFYWLAHTLFEFSGFHPIVCFLLASIFWLFQGLQFVLVLWLWARARARGHLATPALLAAYLGSEAVFPMLFEHYYGNSFHPVPVLMQVADLGGPMLCTAIAMGVQGALYELLAARLARAPLPRLWPGIVAAYVAFAVGYGGYRLAETDRRIAEAPHVPIGVVQTNTGFGENWRDPDLAARRSVEQTLELERDGRPELVIWPESSLTYFLPPGLDDLRRWPLGRQLGLDRLGVPVVLGGLRRVVVDGEPQDRNTAFLLDGEGRVRGTYDKTYLLAFGEFIPFGETFPVVYDLSPMSGRFTPGDDPSPVVFTARDGRDYRLTILICYEDIVSSFVRRAVAVGRPHLLVNITNDSWFGDTQEPWVHLDLARFRAIEHRRYLVRATHSGVSAVIDAAGRVVAHTGTFVRASLPGEVAMLDGGGTLYELLGAWPGPLAILTILVMGWLPERFRRGARSATAR